MKQIKIRYSINVTNNLILTNGASFKFLILHICKKNIKLVIDPLINKLWKKEFLQITGDNLNNKLLKFTRKYQQK